MKIYCPNCFYPNESYQKNCEICKEPIDWKDESYEDKSETIRNKAKEAIGSIKKRYDL